MKLDRVIIRVREWECSWGKWWGICGVGVEGEGRWEGRGWCLRRELCNVQRNSACRVGQAASMIDKVLGVAIMVNHHLLFPFKYL